MRTFVACSTLKRILVGCEHQGTDTTGICNAALTGIAAHSLQKRVSPVPTW